ncbi:origin of replication complex subunit 1B [Trifolium repens]|nr:origin of replication complex subunit 1B [Trifolium repens]
MATLTQKQVGNKHKSYPTCRRISYPGNTSPLLVQIHETVVANCIVKRKPYIRALIQISIKFRLTPFLLESRHRNIKSQFTKTINILSHM